MVSADLKFELVDFRIILYSTLPPFIPSFRIYHFLAQAHQAAKTSLIHSFENDNPKIASKQIPDTSPSDIFGGSPTLAIHIMLWATKTEAAMNMGIENPVIKAVISFCLTGRARLHS